MATITVAADAAVEAEGVVVEADIAIIPTYAMIMAVDDTLVAVGIVGVMIVMTTTEEGIKEVDTEEEAATGEEDGAGGVDIIEESADRDNPPIDSAPKRRVSIRNMQ